MKTMLRGFDGAAATPAASVDAMEERKERRWIISESLYSRNTKALRARSWFRVALCLSLGAVVLFGHKLYSPTPSLKPSGGGIGAVLGHCIEGNRRTWSSLMNSVDDDFE